jgi:hypothetical protein
VFRAHVFVLELGRQAHRGLENLLEFRGRSSLSFAAGDPGRFLQLPLDLRLQGRPIDLHLGKESRNHSFRLRDEGLQKMGGTEGRVSP